MFHVTVRGVARQPIVRDAHDADAFVAQLEETTRRFGWQLLEWCLMPNHAHLVVSATRDVLSCAMHRLCFLHAQRFNNRHDRVGHVFQGRFSAWVVHDEEHLAATRAYVRQNPVRARLWTTRRRLTASAP